MPLAEDIINARYSIQAYAEDQITINETIYQCSLVLSANEIISPWPVNRLDQLTGDHLDSIYDLNPDVILLGTGHMQVFPSADILGLFAKRGVGVEIMNNGALCRTFNILVAEDRQVVAAILQSGE